MVFSGLGAFLCREPERQLPSEAREILKKAKEEPSVRDRSKIGHKFTKETIKKLQIKKDGFLSKVEEKAFNKMIVEHGRHVHSLLMRLNVLIGKKLHL